MTYTTNAQNIYYMKKLALLNFVLLMVIIGYLLLINTNNDTFKDNNIIPEITTQRLNIVGEDGNKYIVLSNPEKQALPTTDGKVLDIEHTERDAGLLFFNEDGDEVGGLVFSIDSTQSSQLLTFDQRKNDQIMVLHKHEYKEDNEWEKQYGLMLLERSDTPLHIKMAELKAIEETKDSIERQKRLRDYYKNPENRVPQRLFVGRTYSEDVGLFLYDKFRKPRLLIYVDKDGEPHIESFDKEGNKTAIQ